MPELSIIIPTKDRGDIFFTTLENIIASTSHSDAEILIINNSLIPIALSSQPANVFVFDNPNNKNSVFSSRNYGASIAKSPIIIFIDDDIIVNRESIDYAISFHAKHNKACLNVNWEYPPSLLNKIRKTTFGRYLTNRGFTSMKSLYGKGWKDMEPFASQTVASFFFCIRRNDFLNAGGYNVRHLHEGTDVDISQKMNENGITIWINPLIKVYHNEIDRVEISNWLERKRRLGVISKQAADMGNISHSKIYSIIKKPGFIIIYAIQPFLIALIKLFNTPKLDALTFRLIDALLGANIYKGYSSEF